MSGFKIAEYLDDHKKYSIIDITQDIIKEHNIPNNHLNFECIKNALIKVIKTHSLNIAKDGKEKDYNSIQCVTFKNELKPAILGMTFDQDNDKLFNNRLAHLGENLTTNTYRLDSIVKYIIEQMNLVNDKQTYDALNNQVCHVVKSYGPKRDDIYQTSWTAACVYLFIEVLKPYIVSLHYGRRNDVKLNTNVRSTYTYGNIRNMLANKYKINITDFYKNSFDQENFQKFGQNQIERKKSGTNPSYLTEHEVKSMEQWTKNYAKYDKVHTVHNNKSKNNKTMKAGNLKHAENKKQYIEKGTNMQKSNTVQPVNNQSAQSKNSIIDGLAPEYRQTIFPESKWQVDDTHILIADPFNYQDQLNVLLKRFLLDRYDLDVKSWKADQEALSSLDCHTQAYANIYQRLLHPEVSYVKAK